LTESNKRLYLVSQLKKKTQIRKLLI